MAQTIKQQTLLQEQQLLEASKRGQTQVVQNLVKSGVFLVCKDALGYTPLHWATWSSTLPGFEKSCSIRLILLDRLDVCNLLLPRLKTAQVNERNKGNSDDLVNLRRW